MHVFYQQTIQNRFAIYHKMLYNAVFPVTLSHVRNSSVTCQKICGYLCNGGKAFTRAVRFIYYHQVVIFINQCTTMVIDRETYNHNKR